MTLAPQPAPRPQLADRLFGSVLGTFDVLSIYVGEKLGLYEGIRAGFGTRDRLADHTGTHPRYTGEWLEQQTVSGILTVDDPTLPVDERKYQLPDSHVEVLLDDDSLAYMSGLIRIVAAAAVRVPDLIEAYRAGSGVSWEQFGSDMRSGQADMNRPFFLHSLGTDWFPAIPDLHAKMTAGGRVADIACGEGWSSIAIALAYPDVRVDGFDIDLPSIKAARRNAQQQGVANRVTFHHGDAADIVAPATYDAVVGFEFVHDLPAPADVLATMRSITKPDGIVVVMDEKVGERFTGEGDDVERAMYGFSLFVCLPDGMSHQPSVATGTVIRPDTMRRYAVEAGFSGVEILDAEADLWRFYRLVL